MPPSGVSLKFQFEHSFLIQQRKQITQRLCSTTFGASKKTNSTVPERFPRISIAANHEKYICNTFVVPNIQQSESYPFFTRRQSQIKTENYHNFCHRVLFPRLIKKYISSLRWTCGVIKKYEAFLSFDKRILKGLSRY